MTNITICQSIIRRKLTILNFYCNINIYLFTIKKNIINILQKNEKNNITFDILDSDNIIQNKLIALKEKHRQMKIGIIWQNILGNYFYHNDLGIGHFTGLDIISYKYKYIIELKNRNTTDNYSSKKSNLDKLSNYKKYNPDYTCIYGTINQNTKEKTLQKKTNKYIIHNGVQIQILSGINLLEFILKDNTDFIINYVKDIIELHYKRFS